MRNLNDVVQYGKELQLTEGYMTATFVAANLKVRGIADIPVELLAGKDVKEITTELRELAKQFGSMNITLALGYFIKSKGGSE